MKIKTPLFLLFLASLVIVLFFFRRPETASAVGSEKNLNISYAVRDGAAPNLTRLDIYSPGGVKNAPVMIMIHGGGWANGDKSNRGIWENKVPFFNGKGFIFISINYRLSPAVKHPAHIEDVAGAVAWAHNNIGKYGGERIKYL